MKTERHNKYAEIMARATAIKLMNRSEAVDRMMDIESADLKFDIKLDEWINSDDFNFVHDFLGIKNNIVRDDFPAVDFNHFISRFAR